MKKINKIILMSAMTVVLGTSVAFITSCGEDQKDISITPSTNEIVNIMVGESASLNFKVENYTYDGEVFLSSADDSGYSSGESEVAKIKFQAQYKGSGVTEVVVEGVEGGTAILVAKTKEGGNKSAQIKINVREYSSTIELKDEHVFVSPNTDLVPDASMFVFSNNSTERDLTYYFVNNGTVNTSSTLSDQGFNYGSGEKLIGQEGGDTLKCLEFKSCSLSADKTELIFTQSDTNDKGEPQTFTKSAYDTQSFYFVVEYDNGTTTKLYKLIKFYAFKGLDNDVFKTTDATGNEISGVDIVTYSSDETSTYAEVIVNVPKSEDTQYCFEYKLSDEDASKVSITRDNIKEDGSKDYKQYYYTIRSKVARRSSAIINFTLYYNNFSGVKDETVSFTKSFNVEVYVKPKTIKVNELEESEFEELKFYNYYVDNYGWKDLKISVYAEDSSFTDCTLTFPDNINIKQGNSIISSGNSISDFSKPIQVRGKSGESVGSGKITLTLNSPFDRDGSDKIKYEINYKIEEGVSELKFTDDSYNYSSSNPSNGIYISTTGGEKTFKGIYANHEFKSATVKSLQNTNVAEVTYLGQSLEGSKNYIELAITPLAEGNDTFEIRLDNGKYINATVRVIKTFDNFTIETDGANTSVYSFERKVDDEGSNTEAEIIIRNPYEENTFGEKAGIKFSSDNGTEVIKDIVIVSVTSANSSIKYNEEKWRYEITTNSNGKTEINFTATGYGVDENFKQFDIKKSSRLFITSYKLAEEFSVYSEEKLANNITLYTGDEVDTNLSTKTLEFKVKSAKAFSFYDYDSESYSDSLFSETFVYWTSSSSITKNGIETDTMYYGGIYKIGGLVEFNTRTMTISALPSVVSNNITLYATIRQYGMTKAFAVNVKIETYTSVTQINVALSGTSISFTKNNTEKSFVVNASPLSATVLDIDFVIEVKDSSKKALILTPKKEKTKDGTWLVTVELDEGV